MNELDVDRSFDYDTLNRLITARLTDTQDWTATAEKTTWYNDDDLGNRISHQYRDGEGDQDGSPNAIGYEHDKANRMTKLVGLDQGYDPAGNLTLAYSTDRGTSYVYKYDLNNRLTGVEGNRAILKFVAWKQTAWTKFLNDELEMGTKHASAIWIENFWKALDRMYGGGNLFSESS